MTLGGSLPQSIRTGVCRLVEHIASFTRRRCDSGDAHLAEEITQAVFIILRASRVARAKTVLSAWLYRTTRYAAADALRARRRRQAANRRRTCNPF